MQIEEQEFKISTVLSINTVQLMHLQNEKGTFATVIQTQQFIDHSSNDAFINSEYIASNDRMNWRRYGRKLLWPS